jgi:hypothetical protein
MFLGERVMTKTSRQTNASPSTSKDVVVSDPTTMLLSKQLNRDESEPPNQQPEEDQGEAIRALAYRKWEAAGCPEGDGTEFWLDAEQEIKVD